MKQGMRIRVVSLFWLFAGVSGLLSWRLVQLQYLDHDYYLKRANAQQLGEVELPALRGEIRDRNGTVLATSVARSSIAIDPEELQKSGTMDQAVDLLRDATNIKESTLRDLVERDSTFAWIARKVDDEAARKVREANLKGVFLLREASPGKRYYPKGRLAAPLMGTTGIDDQGLDGLESYYENQLAGIPGILRAYMDRDGWATLDQASALLKKAEPGHNLILTIDESIQFAAQQELAAQVKKYQAKGGIVVVMDARNAQILAMAVNPDFPAADFAKVPAGIRRNRCVTDPYEPGSTLKIFLGAAALDSGVKNTDRFLSGGVLHVNGWDIHNAEDESYPGAMETVRNIITHSYNVGTTSIALHIGKKAFYKHLLAFGFGAQTGIDLAGESEGILSPASEWADINTATISFGQGVACTPIQLCGALQAIANGGVRMKPHVAMALTDADGNVVKRMEPEEVGRPVSNEVSREILDILRNVVENGTGRYARVPGYWVGGKTGTAQVSENGVYASGQYIASFLGVAPIEDPRLIVLVKIERPNVQWGGVVAAPVFSKVMEKALWRLGVTPDPKLMDLEKRKALLPKE